VAFLAWVVPFVSTATERWDASLVENMRVNRSFMEPLSAGFDKGSTALLGTPDCPLWPFSFGDFAGASSDLTDGGCDERGEADDTELVEVVLAAMADWREWFCTSVGKSSSGGGGGAGGW
jgi:hypothetical protein